MRVSSGHCSGTAQVAQAAQAAQEPRGISARVEAASLLTDLGTKEKKVVLDYQRSSLFLYLEYWWTLADQPNPKYNCQHSEGQQENVGLITFME